MTILENVQILDAGAEGMSVGKFEDQVIFLPYGVPGDIVDVQIIKKKRKYLEGRIRRIVTPSTGRILPHCGHFGICGGCRWQNMTYETQLFYKQKQVSEQLTRIGKLSQPVILPILASPETRYYRNKLDFTFSVYRWLDSKDTLIEESRDKPALGFHVPGFFDKVVDINHCFHQPAPSNEIRNLVREYALAHELAFYNVRNWQGLLRNLIIRNTLTGDLMVILVFRHEDTANDNLLQFIQTSFPAITSLWSVINPKKNDTVYDLEFNLIKGKPYITEVLPPYRDSGNPVQFRIGPISFFQTNTKQTGQLYRTALDFAGISGDEHVYDLYTGTGTIACYAAPYVKHVTGIESVEAAIRDARENAVINGITNATFFAGETEKLLTAEFIRKEGHPDIVITDPPRIGMHEKVVKTLLEMNPPRIVYVSCNPATQARDIALLSEHYLMEKCQPVDMFPHTQHVENVALLTRRD
jgi:23S rRNA (uracil1939-C5)-methyltransferase